MILSVHCSFFIDEGSIGYEYSDFIDEMRGMIANLNAGRYRDIPVRISGSEIILPTPDNIPEEMEKLETWMRRHEHSLHPVIYGAELHRRFVEVHPYADGNGRTARLLMNTVFIQNGYLPCVISPALRLDYIQALEAAHDTPARKGRPEKFIAFVGEMETETQKDFIQSMGLQMPDFKIALQELEHGQSGLAF